MTRQVQATQETPVDQGDEQIESAEARNAARNICQGYTVSVTGGTSVVSVEGLGATEGYDPVKLRDKVCKLRIRLLGSELPFTAVDMQLSYLDDIVALLDSTLAAGDFDDALCDRRERNAAEYEASLKVIRDKQTPLLRSWASFSGYLKAAADPLTGGTRVPTTVFDHDANSLRDNPALLKQFIKALPKRTSTIQDRLYSVLVIPTWLQSTAGLEEYAKIAEGGRILVVAAYKPCGLKEAMKDFTGGGSCQDLKGQEEWRKHIVLVGNEIRACRSSAVLAEDLYIPSAVVLAGKIVAGDDETGCCIANPQAGYQRPINVSTLDGSAPVARWAIEDFEDVNEFRRTLIPAGIIEGRLCFIGCDTLSTHDFEKQYPIMRTKNWIEKCLTARLNKRIFTNLTSDEAQKALKEDINAFLRSISGDGDDKPVAGGKVVRLEPDQNKGPQLFHIDIEIDFKVITDSFELTVKPKHLLQYQVMSVNGRKAIKDVGAKR